MRIRCVPSCDLQQLLTAMRARVPRADGFEAVGRELGCEPGIREHGAEVSDHFAAVAGDEEIAAGAEEMLAILPGRGDHRDAAGQRFERTNGRDAGQRARVWPAWDVDGHVVTGEDLR